MFKPTYHQSLVTCEQSLSAQKPWQLDQFWFYLSKIETKTKQGWQQLTLAKNKWQHDNIVLLGQHCIDSEDSNWQIVFSPKIELPSATQLRFKLGLPFSKNHQSPMRAESIFANSNMFWTWQQGYKYLRLDLQHSQADKQWAFHLGATGCRSLSPIRPPTEPCEHPNDITVTIALESPHLEIHIDLAQLLSNVEPSKQTRCLSLPTQPSCPTLIENLSREDGSSFFKVQGVD